MDDNVKGVDHWVPNAPSVFTACGFNVLKHRPFDQGRIFYGEREADRMRTSEHPCPVCFEGARGR